MSYKNESTYEMSEKDNLIFNNQTFSNNAILLPIVHLHKTLVLSLQNQKKHCHTFA